MVTHFFDIHKPEVEIFTHHLSSEWVIKFHGLFGTADSKVHVIQINHVVKTYIGSLSSLL